ncbi:hypothetical protein [uncultured Dysosmobacter sp.]|uniref:hypothetical protein n=1 Tax=uncultured Dysosmobacter sp. TaxID=2591384 RepID=UPI00260B8C0C|nr:hypothetical protein [uncultured Dysosmobacter sp.]
MASNHTTHYSLSQWQATDEVVRTDFNADNAKIDEALNGLRTDVDGKTGRSEIIREIELAEDTQRAVIDLTGMDWSQWECVFFSLACRSSMSNAGLAVGVNGFSASGHSSASGSAFYSDYPSPFLMALLPRHRPESPVQAVVFATKGGFAYAECTFRELRDLTIAYNADKLQKGTKITLWGIR